MTDIGNVIDRMEELISVTGVGGTVRIKKDDLIALVEFVSEPASVLAEQGEPEWEYGVSSGCGSVDYIGTRESVEARVASFEKAGAPLRPPESIVRRRKVGLWVPAPPVEENGANNA